MAKIFNWIFISTGSHQPISITENTSIDEFLSNAEAAQRSFEAERGTAAIAVSKIGLYSIFYQNTEKKIGICKKSPLIHTPANSSSSIF